jgi:hypothetical protein
MEAAVPALLLVILALGYGSVVAAAGRAELTAGTAAGRTPTGATASAAAAAASRRGSADSSNGAHSSSDHLDTHDEDSDSGSEDEHSVGLLQHKSSSERLQLVPENRALSTTAGLSPPRTSDEDEEFDDELEEESWNSPIKVTQWSVTGVKLKERMPLELLRAAILSRANTATLKSSTSTAVLCGTAMTALLPPVYHCYSLLFGSASSSSSSEHSCDSSAELQSSAALCDASSSAAAILSVCSVAYIAWPIFQEMAVTELTYRRR